MEVVEPVRIRKQAMSPQRIPNILQWSFHYIKILN